jgi:uncharacterized protein YjbJ (UPF0337 family)
VSRKIKEQRGKLTDDEISQIDGNREQLEGKLQERYGYAKDQARKQVNDWLCVGLPQKMGCCIGSAALLPASATPAPASGMWHGRVAGFLAQHKSHLVTATAVGVAWVQPHGPLWKRGEV